MTKITEKNYSDAQEARLASFAQIDNALALELAAEFGKDVKSIRAKAVRMGLYKAQPKVTKTGAKVESKAEVVAQIAALMGVALATLEGLDKAPKPALVALRERLAA